MPRKSERIKLSEKQDRRRKLTTEQKKEIVELYETGNYSLMDLAKQYEVCKKTILLTVNPKSAENARQYRKEHWRDFKLTGEEWNKMQREHRQYKERLYREGKLKEL